MAPRRGSQRHPSKKIRGVRTSLFGAAVRALHQTTLAADIALDRTTTTGALKRLAARRLVKRAVNQETRLRTISQRAL